MSFMVVILHCSVIVLSTVGGRWIASAALNLNHGPGMDHQLASKPSLAFQDSFF